MKKHSIILAIFTLVFMASCSEPAQQSGNSSTSGTALSLPFEIDGITPPEGKPIERPAAGKSSLEDAEILGQFEVDGFTVSLIVGSDEHEQTAVNALSMKDGKRGDEIRLCTYFDMEPAGTDVKVLGAQIELRDFTYSDDNTKTYTGERKIRTEKGKFAE